MGIKPLKCRGVAARGIGSVAGDQCDVAPDACQQCPPSTLALPWQNAELDRQATGSVQRRELLPDTIKVAVDGDDALRPAQVDVAALAEPFEQAALIAHAPCN